MSLHKTNTYDLSGPHEWYWYVSSEILILKRIFHKNHICNFYVLRGVSLCGSSDFLVWWKISHKFCNYGRLYCGCFPHVLLILACDQIFCYIHYIQIFSLLHEQFWCAELWIAYLKIFFSKFHMDPFQNQKVTVEMIQRSYVYLYDFPMHFFAFLWNK